MNSAFVKLLNNSGMFRLSQEDSKLIKIDNQDKNCMLVNFGEIRTLKDDMIIEDGIISANQTVIVRPNVQLVPHLYHTFVSYSPELPLAGLLVSPLSPIVRPKTENGIALVMKATRKTDLNDFSHIFELYQID